MLSVCNNNLNNLYRYFSETTTAMDSNEIDNVKAEKDCAMRRYRHERKFKWFLVACALLFALAHSSSDWLPIAGDFSGDRLHEIISVFRSHLFVFFLFNAIIAAVCALSGRIHIPNDGATGWEQPDLNDEFVTNSESSRRIPDGNDSPTHENPPADEKTVSSENANDSIPVQNRNDTEPKPEPEVSECTEKEKALVVKSYESTQSVTFERRRIVDQSRREFRRSYTEVYRKLTSCGEEEAKKSSPVNQLSNEEFNRAIEAFIADRKGIQREEYKEERKTERYMALTVCQ